MNRHERLKLVYKRAEELFKDLKTNLIFVDDDNVIIHCTREGNQVIEWTIESYNDSDVDYEIEISPDYYILRTYYQTCKNEFKFKERLEVIEHFRNN